MENKSFCIQPFVNVTTRMSGQNNVCCNISKITDNNTGISPIEFFNSKEVKEMRQSMLEGKEIKECSLCHYMEEKGQISLREHYNKYYHLNNKNNYEKTLNSLRLNNLKSPKYLEVHVSNLCNLKCLTCNEKDSSKFHAENKILNISSDPNKDYSVFLASKKKYILEAVNKDLQFLDLRGGETMLVPEIKEILHGLPNNLTKKITLKIQTNGTITPDKKWIAIFKKFKNTKVNISIDAYGDDNYYIRYPSSWNDICNTIDIFTKNNIKFIIHTILSNLNLLVLPKLLRWIYQNKYLNYIAILKDPLYYRYTNLPNTLLEKTMKELKKINYNFVNHDTNIIIENLINNLKIEHNDYNQQWQSFKREIKMRDNFRKNSVFSILPELKEYF
jgi:hypothetical protein